MKIPPENAAGEKIDFAINGRLVAGFLRFWIPIWRDLGDWVAGHQRWGSAVARPWDDRWEMQRSGKGQ